MRIQSRTNLEGNKIWVLRTWVRIVTARFNPEVDGHLWAEPRKKEGKEKGNRSKDKERQQEELSLGKSRLVHMLPAAATKKAPPMSPGQDEVRQKESLWSADDGRVETLSFIPVQGCLDGKARPRQN